MFRLPAFAAEQQSVTSDGVQGTAVQAKDGRQDSLLLDVSYGYDNSAKAGRYLPVQLTVTNTGPDAFSGTAGLLIRESDGDVYEYDYPIVVASGRTTEKRCYVPLGSGSDEMVLRLCGPDGKQAASRRVKLNVISGYPELFIGILSDTPEKLSWLNGASLNYGQVKTRTFTLTGEGFPEDKTGLDQLDMIVVSSYDMSRLTVEQTRALMQWMRDGGVLFLGTGNGVNTTIGLYAPEFLDDMYDMPEETLVSPGGAAEGETPESGSIRIPLVRISLHGGSVVLENAGKALVTTANIGTGMLAVAGFDLTDLKDYAETHSAFVNGMLYRVLGSIRTDRIAKEAYGYGQDEYWSAQSLIGSGGTDSIPDMRLYSLAIIAYILLAGPGLYLFLKEHGQRTLYRNGVIILAVSFTAVIYLMGSRTRFRSTFYHYATIREAGADAVNETTYLNLGNPYNASYSVAVNSSYAVLPLTGNDSVAREESVLDGNTEANVAVSFGRDKTGVSVRDVGAFSSKLFRLTRNEANTEDGGFSGSLTLFGDLCSGEVTNRYAYPVRDAVIVFYGKAISLGRLEAGETKEFSDMQCVSVPLNSPGAVAEEFTADGDIEGTGILSFFLKETASGYVADATVIAFPEKEQGGDILQESDLKSSGVTLLVSSVPVNRTTDGLLYRPALFRTPSVLNGDYLASTNSVYAGEPTVLKYDLGSDIRVRILTFEEVGEEFSGAGKGSGAGVFRGETALYNYQTGNFDTLPEERRQLKDSDLLPYLSPDNTVTVRYAPSDTTEEGEIDLALPVPTVIGEVR